MMCACVERDFADCNNNHNNFLSSDRRSRLQVNLLSVSGRFNNNNNNNNIVIIITLVIISAVYGKFHNTLVAAKGNFIVIIK
jgi:hypothetical protein